MLVLEACMTDDSVKYTQQSAFLSKELLMFQWSTKMAMCAYAMKHPLLEFWIDLPVHNYNRLDIKEWIVIMLNIYSIWKQNLLFYTYGQYKKFFLLNLFYLFKFIYNCSFNYLNYFILYCISIIIFYKFYIALIF